MNEKLDIVKKYETSVKFCDNKYKFYKLDKQQKSIFVFGARRWRENIVKKF